MSADELRQAAEALRTLANRASDHPWSRTDPEPPDCGGRCCPTGEVFDPSGHAIIDAWQVEPRNADYIASVHPGTGLALAEWLDAVAIGWVWDEHPDDVETPDGWPLTLEESTDAIPLKIARLINGGAS